MSKKQNKKNLNVHCIGNKLLRNYFTITLKHKSWLYVFTRCTVRTEACRKPWTVYRNRIAGVCVNIEVVRPLFVYYELKKIVVMAISLEMCIFQQGENLKY